MLCVCVCVCVYIYILDNASVMLGFKIWCCKSSETVYASCPHR